MNLSDPKYLEDIVMPIYQYRCPKCGNLEEHIEKFDAPNTRQCCKCKATSQRILSLSAPPQFKGDGFYKTDYKDKGK